MRTYFTPAPATAAPDRPAFTPPVELQPRTRYRPLVESRRDGWPTTSVHVYDLAPAGDLVPGAPDAGKPMTEVPDGALLVGSYERNHSMLGTFESFRQRDEHGTWHDHALISQRYTRTAVMDLATGEIIAEEDETYYDAERTRPGAGFCPAEFHVFDWWDIHDGSILPGDKYWGADCEVPDGTLGFVAGCHWGDDTSWKLQVLDLSQIRHGRITRDERFGYLELPGQIRLRDAIRWDTESMRVRIAVEVSFDLATGEASTWSIDGLNTGAEVGSG